MLRVQKQQLVWGLWLPSAELESRYWAAHHAHCTLQDTVFFVLFLSLHVPAFFTVIPSHTQPLFFVAGVSMYQLLEGWGFQGGSAQVRHALINASHGTPQAYGKRALGHKLCSKSSGTGGAM